MKICINCTHWLRSEVAPHNTNLSRCAWDRPISLVTGDPVPIDALPYADHERRVSGRCGLLGTNYEFSTLPILTVEEEAELLAGDIRHE
jgi:hypothetical protein